MHIRISVAGCRGTHYDSVDSTERLSLKDEDNMRKVFFTTY